MASIVSEKQNPNLPEQEKSEGNSIEKTSEENIADKMKEQVEKLTPSKTEIVEPKAKHRQTLGIVNVSQCDLSQRLYGQKRGNNVFHS